MSTQNVCMGFYQTTKQESIAHEAQWPNAGALIILKNQVHKRIIHEAQHKQLTMLSM